MTRIPMILEGVHSTFHLSRPGPSVLLVVVYGHDASEHGDRPLRVLEEELRSGPAALFVDARHTRAASPEVSRQWAEWLSAHRDRLLGIHLLPGSWFIQMTAEVVREYAQLDGLLHVHASARDFDAALREATER